MFMLGKEKLDKMWSEKSPYDWVDSVVLEDLVDEFIEWCESTYGSYESRKVKDFIEKMASWYEAKTPSTREYRTICDNIAIKSIKTGLAHNYEDMILNQDELFSKLGLIDNSNIFSFKLFMELNGEAYLNVEGDYFKKSFYFLEEPKYDNREFILNINGKEYEFYVTGEGIVVSYFGPKFVIYDVDGEKYEFDNIYLNDFKEYLESENFVVEGMRAIDSIIDRYNVMCKFREGTLDAVMYKLIDRGGDLGIIRAYLFALEFGRDPSVVLSYGLPELPEKEQKILIDDYLNRGGDILLECMQEYDEKKGERLAPITLETLRKLCNISEEVENYRVRRNKKSEK